MKILNAGTELLDDKDVLKYIKDKREQHKAEDQRAKVENRTVTKRPANYLRILKKTEEHLEHFERPFKNNPKYDEDERYLTLLISKLQSRVKLTKPEIIMLLNHRPGSIEFMTPMIEDIDARVPNEEDQQWIVDTVVEVLGVPNRAAELEAKAAEG